MTICDEGQELSHWRLAAFKPRSEVLFSFHAKATYMHLTITYVFNYLLHTNAL